MIKRMIGASKLDPAVYEEVDADSSATRQAMAVVVLSHSQPESECSERAV